MDVSGVYLGFKEMKIVSFRMSSRTHKRYRICIGESVDLALVKFESRGLGIGESRKVNLSGNHSLYKYHRSKCHDKVNLL